MLSSPCRENAQPPSMAGGCADVNDRFVTLPATARYPDLSADRVELGHGIRGQFERGPGDVLVQVSHG